MSNWKFPWHSAISMHNNNVLVGFIWVVQAIVASKTVKSQGPINNDNIYWKVSNFFPDIQFLCVDSISLHNNIQCRNK